MRVTWVWLVYAALLALGLALLVGAWRAHQDAVRQQERDAVSQRDIDRLKAENDALRAEIRALEEDPVYVEAVLRERGLVRGPGEKKVE